MNKLLILLFLAVLLFTRFWNAGNTARFTRDESYDIVKLHQYWIEKRITLIGAIDYTGSIVYTSFFYYSIMPFAVIGNFEPQSTVYAISFYGSLAAIIFLLIAKIINRKLLFWCALLVLFWFPLVQAGRWSWNPHVLPFWMGLGVLAYLKKKKIFLFSSGVFFGLSFHIHYISFISVATFLAPLTLINLWKKRYADAFYPLLGFILLIIPFVIFDLRHPPGLFFTGYLKRNLVTEQAGRELAGFSQSFIANIQNSFYYLTQNGFLSKIAIVLFGALAYLDLRKKDYRNLIYIFPIITQIAIISFLPSYENRYFLPSLVFLFTYLILPREKLGERISRSVILLFILGSLMTLKSVLTRPIIEPPPRVVGEVTNYIKQKVLLDELKNINIAVLASPDPDPIGLSYRDILLTKDVEVLPSSQYSLTDNLFIVSSSGEDVVRSDPANVMEGFRKGRAETVAEGINSKWEVYLFKRE